MKSLQQWVMDRQVKAEIGVLMELVEHPGEWVPVRKLFDRVRISPWRMVGAINRLSHARKVQVAVCEHGNHLYSLTPAGRAAVAPAE